MRRLFIVRHGNTFSSDEPPRRIGARTDIPLVASGLEQAQALGDWFANAGIHFDHAWSAPLMRTQQTAHAILRASPSPCPISHADFLTEIDHGPDENAPEDAVVARIGAAAIAAWDERAEAPDGWITDRDARVGAWTSFLADRAGGTGLLVTSNGAARFALVAMGLLGNGPSLKLRTGAYGEIILDDAGGFSILCWDQRPALVSGSGIKG